MYNNFPVPKTFLSNHLKVSMLIYAFQFQHIRSGSLGLKFKPFLNINKSIFETFPVFPKKRSIAYTVQRLAMMLIITVAIANQKPGKRNQFFLKNLNFLCMTVIPKSHLLLSFKGQNGSL